MRDLQRNLEIQLSSLGFPAEKRGFSPHLTLARLRSGASREEQEQIGRLITTASLEQTHFLEVGQINLMQSQLTREGAIYTQIGQIPLK